jgi:tripartite-type tricarboxylate transporter receptor subunit TctC
MIDKDNGVSGHESNRRTFLKAAGGSGAVALTGLSGCTGQLSGGGEFPSDDIEIVVPWAAGGGTDQATRKLVEVANAETDLSFYVSNVSGATGGVGMREVADAEPDGYKICAETLEIVVLDHMGIADLQPDDLRSVMQYNALPASLTVHEDAEYGTLEEYVQYAEENPGEINVSTAGTGSFWHLGSAGFALENDIEVEHVPYDGGAPATEALLNGEVQATAAAPPEVAGQVNDGPLTTLGIMGEERAAPLPDVPTFIEEGYDWTMGTTFSIAVPLDTPQDRIDTIHEATKTAFDTDEFQSFMTNTGFTPTYRNGEEFAQFKQEQYERAGEIIDELGLSS